MFSKESFKKIQVNTSCGVKIPMHKAKSNIYADEFSRQKEKPSGSLQLHPQHAIQAALKPPTATLLSICIHMPHSTQYYTPPQLIRSESSSRGVLTKLSCVTCWHVPHTPRNMTQLRVIHLQGEHYRNTPETHARMASMPSLRSLLWFKLALRIRQIKAALGNTTSGVRPVVLLGAETRGSPLEQQWNALPITDVLLQRSTGSAPDTRLIWQMLRRKVRGQKESRHIQIPSPPYRPAAPSSTQRYALSAGWQIKKIK